MGPKPRCLQSTDHSWGSPPVCNSKQFIPAPARRVFYGAVKLGPLYGTKSMEHYCILHLILIKWFSIAKLVCITTHTGSIVCIFEDANFICDKKGLWQSTLKLITLCLHKLLNSDKCLK